MKKLDATCYFIVLLIGSTCFGHYYAYHQDLGTMMLLTTLVVLFLVCCRLEVRCWLGWSSFRVAGANQEQYHQCGKQYHSRELLMMGIVMPETC